MLMDILNTIKYASIEQVHGVVNTIIQYFENKEYCSVFLGVQQAFDRAWYHGYYIKLKDLSHAVYLLLKTNLKKRTISS